MLASVKPFAPRPGSRGGLRKPRRIPNVYTNEESSAMIANFFKVALRNLWKRKLFSVINIVGLSVGIACFFLIAVHVLDEFSYDNFHEDAENLYRVALERIYPDNVVFYAIIPHSIPVAMQNIWRFVGSPLTSKQAR